MLVEKWTMAEEIGYKPITTFWQDFYIAEAFGKEAIIDTFHEAFNEWKDDYKYLTELVLVLNHKISRFYGRNNEYAYLYNDLWEKADSYAYNNLEGEERSYFLRTTD